MIRYSDWEWDTLDQHDEPGWDCERLDRLQHTEPAPNQYGVKETIQNRLRPHRGEGSHVYKDWEWEQM